MPSSISDDLRAGALVYHRTPRPGKLEIQPTKPLGNQRDLALAYTPGVAAACEAIAADPAAAAELTTRANLVGVVSNGTAVLGLGNIGPLASKPVMEGKAVLFKKFAGIDVFDIEIAANEVERIVEVVAALEPTFGGINLEDIKAPECFEVEARLKERMKIPVFHDDQHGTAIIVAAAVLNALHLAGKSLDAVKIVASGAGAAALACLNLLVSLGAKPANIWVTDLEGVVYEGRPKLMDRWKAIYAQKTDKRTLAEVIEGADVFLGVSAGGVLKPDMVKRMAERPLIMALANPTPEIMPDEAYAARPDAIICTGRSDYPNQVNNVLCFPYIFRGALDVGATTINEEMKRAAVEAIAGLAREAPSEVAARAYGGEMQTFGPGSLIPESVRPAADPAHRAGGRQGGGRLRCRDAPDRRLRHLRRAAKPFRVPLRLHHEAGVCAGEGSAKARHLCGRRGRTDFARDPGRRGGGACPPDPGRPPAHHRAAHQPIRTFDSARPGL